MMVGIDCDNAVRDYYEDGQIGQDDVKASIVLGGRCQASVVVGTMQELNQRSYSKWYRTLDMRYVSDCKIGMDLLSLKYVCTRFSTWDTLSTGIKARNSWDVLSHGIKTLILQWIAYVSPCHTRSSQFPRRILCLFQVFCTLRICACKEMAWCDGCVSCLLLERVKEFRKNP